MQIDECVPGLMESLTNYDVARVVMEDARDRLRIKVQKAWAQGFSAREISRQLGISNVTISKWVK